MNAILVKVYRVFQDFTGRAKAQAYLIIEILSYYLSFGTEN
jgi:hypothetical protein